MIREIELKDWKNHEHLKLDFAQGLNFIIGPNGAGKTAILQAINFAICSAWEKFDKDKYVRKGCSQSEIIVKFAVADRNFTLRSLVDSQGVQTTLEEDISGTSFSGSLPHEKLQNLFQLPTVARERLLHVREGEVHILCFPSTQLTMLNQEFARQMRTLLGLQQIDSLIDVIREIRRQAREEVDLIEQQLGDAINREKVSTVEKRIKDNEASLEQIVTRRKATLDAKESSQKALWKLEEQVKILKEAMNKASSFLEEVRQSFGDRPSLEGLRHYVEQIILESRKSLQDLASQERTLLARIDGLKGRREIYSDLIKFVKSSNMDQQKVTECPLCHQPLTQERLERIIEELGSQLREIDEELSKCSRNIEQIVSTRQQYEKRLKQADGPLLAISELEKQVGPTEEIQNNLAEAEKKKAVAEREVAHFLKEFDRYDTEYKQKIALIETDKSILKRPLKENLEIGLQNAMRHDLLAETIAESLSRVGRRQEEVISERVIKKLNKDLEGFPLPGKGSVYLDESAIPYVMSAGERYDFDMLSAGERTSIYILARVLLNRIISRVNFIMIDEPFEHLDSVNRRYLRDFLRQATNSSFLSQVIVTTYEETLTRTFLEGTEAKLHYIS